LLLMPIVDTRALPNNELTAEQNQIDWNCKVKYHGTEIWAWSICSNLLYPRNSPYCKLFTDALKGTHKDVSDRSWIVDRCHKETVTVLAILLIHQGVNSHNIASSEHSVGYLIRSRSSCIVSFLYDSDNSNPLQFLLISNPKQTHTQ
jgi:hypothetical protein